MKLNLDNVSSTRVPEMLRDVKAMRSLHVTVGGKDIGRTCSMTMDAEGRMTLAFEDPKHETVTFDTLPSGGVPLGEHEIQFWGADEKASD